MKSSLDDQNRISPGRPAEIEEASNRLLVHPTSRRIVDLLLKTPVTPNQVSIASVFVAGAGAWALWRAPWPANGLVALGFLFFWHVLDGADGDLARRSGRASVSGELVDGICDHASQVLVYVALAAALSRTLGSAAWWIASVAGLCHFVQANAYETGRKTYRRWVYGAAWMKQGFAGANPIQRALSGLYLFLSAPADPGEALVTQVMTAEGDPPDSRRRAVYRELYAPLVKSSSILSSNSRTLAACGSVLAGSPLWFFLFEIVVLNLAVLWLLVARRGRDQLLIKTLASG
jgi:phosphatidylglycerophosphate synthase